MVRIVHNAVRGRIRFRVKGLYRCVTLKVHLERQLPGFSDITSVSASVLTGNVLIIFNPQCNPKKISESLERVALQCLQDVAACADQDAGETRKRQPVSLKPVERKTVDGAQPARSDWHVIDTARILATLETSPTCGLAATAIGKHRELYGANVLHESETRSRFDIFIDQFKSLPVALLGVAAGVSVFTGGIADALVIAAVVGINAVIGYLTETDAEETIQSLKSLVAPSARVMREGSVAEISAEEVVVGDLLLLRPGTYIAADARLVEAVHLTVDESILTGESMPVVKTASTLGCLDVPLGDRFNMIYGGTLVTGGHGSAVVVATGLFSEIGRIQALVIESEPPETPIERQLTEIGNQLVLLSGAICALVFVIGLLRGNGALEMFKTAISLAVAAVPEGLPAVATTTFALGIKNMRRRKILVRSLEAVCTLGSIQTICFDKTGTVTLNKMSVMRLFSGMQRINVNGGGLAKNNGTPAPIATEEVLRLVQICVLCNETEVTSNNGSHVLSGTSTENALILLAYASGVDVEELRSQYPRLETNHRSDDRQFMTTAHDAGESGRLVALKGSPLEVLAKCSTMMKDGATDLLSEDDRDFIESENASMAGDALRVLGVGFAVRNGNGRDPEENGFTWLGLVGMADPIREGVKQSVGALQRAGLDTVMITGDQSLTAHAVGTELGLNRGMPLKILDSTHLGGADPEVLKALSGKVHVFSRVSPSHKLQIVQSLQSSGRVVAMTGDGINDGPALKAADVGIAMGQGGTDVAREVADVILEEDDLEMLTIAISDGRTIYRNIRKTLHYLIATNFSEIQVMFLAGALGLGHPLNAMQLLWINLISDIFPGLALALEPAEPDVMKTPPRDPQEPIMKREDFGRITFEACAMTAASLASYGYGIMRYGAGAHAGTLAFQSLTTSQILQALSCRSEKRTLLGGEKRAPNHYLTAAVLGSLGLQLIAQLVPGIRGLLGITPLTALDTVIVGVTAVIPLLVSEATKEVRQVNQE